MMKLGILLQESGNGNEIYRIGMKNNFVSPICLVCIILLKNGDGIVFLTRKVVYDFHAKKISSSIILRLWVP
jgi:hypothetical protein